MNDNNYHVEAYLVQRVCAPQPYGQNPFAFGGGGHGLGPTALELVNAIFSADYMGAAQYEFNALPACLGEITTAAPDLVQHKVTIKVDEIGTPWRLKNELRRKRTPKTKQALTDSWKRSDEIEFYVVCHKDLVADVEADIRRIAKNEPERGATRDATHIDRYAWREPESEQEDRVIGWLALDGGYFFSVDESMTQRFWDMTQKFVETAEGSG